MERNDNICIKLYTKEDFKGKFYLKYGDALQIEFWWRSQKKENNVQYEKIINF